jgi:hypothetical protein
MASIVENSRIKKLMGIIKEEELIRNVLTSDSLKNNKDFKSKFLGVLKEIFIPLGNWGTADNPAIDCYTFNGVIGVHTFTDYSQKMNVPNSNWSVINFFITSGVVLDSLLKSFRAETTVDETVDNFIDYVKEYIKNNLHTDKIENLAIENLKKIRFGFESEKSVFDTLINTLKLPGNINFCPGSKSDAKQGVDFILTKGDAKATFQVKQLLFLNDNKTSFEVLTKKYPASGYDLNDVDYLIFVNTKKNIYYIFENESDLKITTGIKSKKGFIYDKVIFKSGPIKPEEIKFK